ncbi:MAG: peptidoglycan-binding domain-containing protein [Lentilitoribacter sp.]
MILNVRTILLSVLFSLPCLLVYAANSLPFPDGRYARSETFCAMSPNEVIEHASQIGFLVYNIKNGNLFDGADPRGFPEGSVAVVESNDDTGLLRTQVENVRELNSIISYDVRTFDEGEETIQQHELERKGPTAFGLEVYTFHLCGENGKFAKHQSTTVAQNNASLTSNNQQPNYQGIQEGQLTFSELIDLQWIVKWRGFYKGYLDGDLNESFWTAFEEFKTGALPNVGRDISHDQLREIQKEHLFSGYIPSLLQSRDSIANVQRALHAVGTDPGSIDGQWDQRSINALAGFQQRYGFTVNGQIDLLIYDRLLKAQQLLADLRQSNQNGVPHRYKDQALAFYQEAIRPRNPVGSASIYATGTNLPFTPHQTKNLASSVEKKDVQSKAPLPSSPTLNEPATLKLKTHAGSLPSNLPKELQFQIQQPIYKPRHVKLANCNDRFGTGIFTESDGHTLKQDDLFVSDVCISEEQRTFRYLDSYSDFFLKQDNDFGKSYSQKGRRKKGNLSFTFCGEGCKANFATGRASKLLGFSGGAIPGITSISGTRKEPTHSFAGFGYSSNDRPTQVSDGVYDIRGAIQPAFQTALSVDLRISGNVHLIDSQITVKDGIGVMELFKPAENYLSTVYLRVDFNNPQNNILLAHSPDSTLSGQKSTDVRILQSQLNHLVPIISKGDWGLVGAGDANAISYNGAVSSGQVWTILSATPAEIKDSVAVEYKEETLSYHGVADHPYPEPLKKNVKANIYTPRWLAVSGCADDRGMLSVHHSRSGDKGPGTISLIEVCYSGEKETLGYLNAEEELHLKNSFYNNTNSSFTFKEKIGHFTICSPGCDAFFFRQPHNPKGLSNLSATLDLPATFYPNGTSKRKRSNRAHGVGGGRYQPDWNSLDGEYQVTGSIRGRAVGPGIEGILVVKNGIGRLQNFDPKFVHSGLVDLTIDFKNPDNSRAMAYVENGQIEGRTTSTYRYAHYDVRHMVAMHQSDSIGIVGGGNGDVVYYGGRTEAALGQLFLIATKLPNNGNQPSHKVTDNAISTSKKDGDNSLEELKF